MTDPDPATIPAGHLHLCGCVPPSVNTLTLSNYQRGYDAGRADERLADYQAASNEIHDITDGPGQLAWAAFHRAWMDGVQAVQDQARGEGAIAERRLIREHPHSVEHTHYADGKRCYCVPADLLDGDDDV